MPARDDLLEALGLLPVWRLRASAKVSFVVERAAAISEAPPAPQPRVGAPTSDERDPGEAEAHATGTAAIRAPAAAESAAERLARIGILEWRDFAADVDACTACALCRTRRKSVPGVGDVRAQWLFVGEAPGSEEDAKGEPFVGQAGKLLDAMLAALGLERGKNVYIANVLKCRPPNNRTPEPREVEACRPYLDRQIALIAPRVVVALGKSAATTLLDVDATIASLRGRVHRYQGVPLVVTYHPAYLLRNLPDKAKAWEDLLLARRTLASALATANGPTSPTNP